MSLAACESRVGAEIFSHSIKSDCEDDYAISPTDNPRISKQIPPQLPDLGVRGHADIFLLLRKKAVSAGLWAE